MSEYIVNLSGDWANKQGEKLTEIVRCRDCKYFEPDGEHSEVYPDRYWCDKLTVYMSQDGFCSFGKQKEDGE